MDLTVRAADPIFKHTMQDYTKAVSPVISILRECRYDKIWFYLTPRFPDSPLLELLSFSPESCESLRDATLSFDLDSAPIAQDIVDSINLDNTEQLSALCLEMELRSYIT